jgi:hypothetical protein
MTLRRITAHPRVPHNFISRRTALDSGTQPTISPRAWRARPRNESVRWPDPQSEEWIWTTDSAVGLAVFQVDHRSPPV